MHSTRNGTAMGDYNHSLSTALFDKKMNMQSSSMAWMLAEGKTWKKILKKVFTEKSSFRTSKP